MNVITRNIPNAVTCFNITAGCLAIILALKPEAAPSGLTHLQWAYIFIGIAALADFLDGFCARMLRAYSELGKELDSLCDAVSFGVAPAALLFASLSQLHEPGFTRWLAVIIPVAGVLRLARFNIDTRQTTSFIGMPIPANAIFWTGYTALMQQGAQWLARPAVAIPAILLVSWLMLSPIHLFSLKFKTWGWKGNEARWILIIAAVTFIFCCGVSGLMWLILFYILLSQLPFAKK